MQKKKVLPGEAISTEEEFEPGQNAFADDGNIYSAAAGSVETDPKQKLISVEPGKKITTLHRGSTIFGIVHLVKDNSVLITILQGPDKGSRIVIGQRNAMLPVRSVSREYVENLRDAFKIGDLVKAKISKINPMGTDLTTAERELGVIKAFCSQCRQPLHLFGTSLKCLKCGHTEQRKVSSDYSLK